MSALWDSLEKIAHKVRKYCTIHNNLLLKKMTNLVLKCQSGLCPHGFDPLQESLTNLTQRRTILLETGSLGTLPIFTDFNTYIRIQIT